LTMQCGGENEWNQKNAKPHVSLLSFCMDVSVIAVGI
jgi:hypothetical protein